VGIDNHALIMGLQKCKHANGQWAVDRARDQIDSLTHDRGCGLTFRWTPGHCGIDGNEAADVAAKLAADGPHGSSDAASLPRFAESAIPRSTAAIHQAFADRIRRRAARRWKGSRRHNKTSRIDDTMPSRKYLALVHLMPRSQSTLMIWLRTGHAPLNHHLHRIHAVESPGCAACDAGTEETVKHYLLDCPAYERARRTLRRELGVRKAGDIQFLLSDARATGPLMAFADDTKRFTDALGTLVVPPIVWPPPEG
jgi:hypothetical protein